MRHRLFPFQGPRLTLFRIVMLLAFSGLVARMYYFQFTLHDQFDAAARENSIQQVPLAAPRGVIYDRYGNDLARNDASFNVGIVPANLPDNDEDTLVVLNRLSALIDVPATRASADSAGKKNIRSLEEMVKEGEGIAPYRDVIVATDVDREIAQQIEEDKQDLPGVVVDFGPVRQYPSGSYTAQVIGYLGPIGEDEAEQLREQGYNPAYERVGYAGVEAYLDDDLSGKRGLETREVDVAGLPVRVIQRDEPQPGRNVRLTIDLDLQKAVHQALETQIQHINDTGNSADPKAGPTVITQSGVVIVMNPNTGEILSMVSLPTYDNSRFARSIDATYYFQVKDQPQFPFINHAISSLYPPGSTWKLITGSSVVQEDVIAPDSQLFDGGDLLVENKLAANATSTKQRFVCWYRKGHGNVSLIYGIAWSCDVYFYQIGGGNPAVAQTTLKPGGLGIEGLDRYATMFGIGTKEGIELPAEAAGRLPDPDWKRRTYSESWGTGDTYNAAFGQGFITVTPLQLVNAVSSIVNGGTLYQPTLINSWTDSAGNVLQGLTPKVERTVVLPTDGSPAVLDMREDMYLQGPKSIPCVCEPNSPFNHANDPSAPDCNSDFLNNYRGKFTLHRPVHTRSVDYHPNDHDVDVTYTVLIPYRYTFSAFNSICDPLRFDKNYQPPFIDPQNLALVRQGMYGAVTLPGGTVNIVVSSPDEKARILLEGLAGKTGTAEYCDNIALGKNLCIPGSWPSHAWFVGFAPYDKPQVVALAFVYNGGEGSLIAYPMVEYAISCYLKLQLDRSHPGTTPSCPAYIPPQPGTG